MNTPSIASQKVAQFWQISGHILWVFSLDGTL
jgi:hypothetical protein